MGSQSFQFLNPFAIPVPYNNSSMFFHDIRTNRRCFSGDSCSDWSRNLNPNRRSKFSDLYVTDDYDEDDEFSSGAQRVWWSDDIYEDDDDDEEFGIVQGSIDFSWISKVFQAFGWMIPAVIMSLLLGTNSGLGLGLGSGSSSIVMALALPLVQSALSLAVEKLWGRSVETPRPKYKNKKRPSARRASNFRARKGKGNWKETGDYKSWVAGNNVSTKNENRSGRDFGGWD